MNSSPTTIFHFGSISLHITLFTKKSMLTIQISIKMMIIVVEATSQTTCSAKY